jgi:Regulator of chromosome condensation (RCC1) repeat
MRYALAGAITATLIAGLAVPVTASATGRAPSPTVAPNAAVAPTTAQVGGSLVTVPVRRLVDTRPSGPVRSVLVDASGRVGTGALAAVLAITVVRPTRSSYLTVYPDGAQPPVALSQSFTAGRTSTNTVVANLSGSARVAVRLAVPANVVVDLLGYFTSRDDAQPAGSYHPVSPKRIVDTRQRLGGQPLAAGGTESLQVAGVAGVPTTGITAVAVNLVTVGSTASGYLTAYPDGQPLPHSASVSFPAGLTIANRVIVGISNGRLRVFNASAGTTQFMVEIVGYFGAAAGGSYYHPLQHGSPNPPNIPVRVADSRIDPPRNGVLTVSQTVLTDQIEGFASWDSTLPPTAVIASVSVFGERGPGSITAYPTGGVAPATTDLPYTSGQASNQVLAPLAHGSFSLRLSGATTQLTVDVSGYFARLRPATTSGLWGWGWSSVGRADLVSSSAPVKIADSTGVIGLSTSGWYANYLIRDDHTVQGWGYGPFGAGRTYSRVPVPVPGATAVVSVVANATPDDNEWGTAFALRSNGTVLAWGQNARGQLADGNTNSRNSVAVIAGLTGITQLAAGWTAGYALKSDGTVWAWGDNAAGQLGQGSVGGYFSSPVQVPGLTGIVAIAADQNEAWAVSADGSLSQWGSSDMNIGPTATPAAPFWTAGACPARKVVASDQQGAVLCQDGTVWAWDLFTRRTPPWGATIPGLSGVSDLFTQEGTTFALTSAGTVWRWGFGSYNALGNGYTWSWQAGSDWPEVFAAPAPMPDLAGITMIGGFRQGTFVLR